MPGAAVSGRIVGAERAVNSTRHSFASLASPVSTGSDAMMRPLASASSRVLAFHRMKSKTSTSGRAGFEQDRRRLAGSAGIAPSLESAMRRLVLNCIN